jgi:hypothetical protein
MAKKRGNRVPVGQLTPAQEAAFEAQLALQERALRMAQAQADREQAAYEASVAQQRERAEREAQFNALNEIANIYSGQVGDYGRQFDAYGSQVEGQREAALRQLAESVGRAETGIGSAQEQFLRDLVSPQAYQNVPLLELGQIANPLLGVLAAEGASAAGVEAQSAQDAQIAAQLAAMTRGAMGQLNVGEQNYLTALRNAGALAAQQARTGLAGQQAMAGQGIRSQYDQLAQQIAQQRLEAVSRAEAQAAEARAQAQGYAPVDSSAVPAPFDYAGSLENARRAALAQIRAALPQRTAPVVTGTTGTTGKTGTTGTKKDNKKKGGVRDILGNLPPEVPEIG